MCDLHEVSICGLYWQLTPVLCILNLRTILPHAIGNTTDSLQFASYTSQPRADLI